MPVDVTIETDRKTTDVRVLVESILARASALSATDIHFEPDAGGLRVRIRVDGQLVDLQRLPASVSTNVIARIKVLASLLTYRVDIPQEGSFLWKGSDDNAAGAPADMRVATFPTIRGERALVRIFRNTPALESVCSLGLAGAQVRAIQQAVASPTGLVVVSGPAGSGKTTTLYAMVRDSLDRFPGRSVITLEDPVEQRVDGVTQVQVQPHGELTYTRCMRSLLRQDPQVLMLGEVRDRETAMVAFEAALTGHVVFTTLHSGDPAECVVRFLEMGIPPYQLVSALSLICSLRLLRKLCRSCGAGPGRGCDECLGTGYAGRVAIGHVLSIDTAGRDLILGRAGANVLRNHFGGDDLASRAARLIAEGVTDADEVGRVLGEKPEKAGTP